MAEIFDKEGSVETARLIHRPFTVADIPRFVEMRADRNVNKYIGGIEINTPEWLAERLNWYLETYNAYGWGIYAIIWKETGEIIGWSGLQKFRDEGDIEIGYGMIEEFWGLGIATETAEFWIDFAFNVAKLEKLVAVADVKNVASNKVLRNIGLIQKGETNHFGMHCNYYELTRCEFQNQRKGLIV